MSPAPSGTGMDRRHFLKLTASGVASLAVLGTSAQLAGCSRAVAPAPGQTFLTPADLALFGALLPVVNGAAFPDDAAVRDEALRRIDLVCISLEAPARAEARKLLDLLHWGLFRRLACGFSADWTQATPTELTAFLQRWRDSRMSLLNAGHRALVKLAGTGWWSQPASWSAAAYPGPPAWALTALNTPSAPTA